MAGVITFRTFRNWDPPALVDLWNRSFSSRGAARNIDLDDLDRLVLAKPYFDPGGLIVAETGGRVVGFVHAGFGASDDNTVLDRQSGVIVMLLVDPQQRRQGIGRALVERAERYLRDCGSQVIYAGGIYPLDPFYLGLYGGSELPGVLRSDGPAQRLFEAMGYRAVDECLVFQRSLSRPLGLSDLRARSWSRRLEFEVQVQPVPENWWTACRYACLDCTGFRLLSQVDGQAVARATGWEIHPLGRTWGTDAVGIVDVQVAAECRCQGIGTLLMTQVLRHYRSQGLLLAEVQTMARNEAARRLYQRLGFRQVDSGLVYRYQGR